jgi:hypothetical protein
MQPEVRKICCPENATTRGQKKGKIAFAYPVEYPRRMTDRGMYAKISAYRDGLNIIPNPPRTELRIHRWTFLHQEKNLVTPFLQKLWPFRPTLRLSLVCGSLKIFSKIDPKYCR